MTTTPAQQPDQPADDLMALADAVGVTRAPTPIHPALRPHLTDANLDAVVSTWARAYAEPDCPTCEDTGMVDARCWFTGRSIVITCLACSADERGAS